MVEGSPADKWVKAAAHPSFLPMGRAKKLGWWRHSLMRWVLRWLTSWEGRGSSGAGVPGEKGSNGVLEAPLSVEWVTTAGAVEVPTIGWLLTASSCTDGEKVVRAAAGLREKRSGAVMRGGRRRDGLTGGGAECGRETRQHGTLGL
jgi:hypothetical protein